MSLFSAPNPLSTVILRTVARVTCPLLVLFSVYLLLRGHRLPGGGFIAGLMTASAIMLVYLAYGYRAVTTMKGPLAHYLYEIVRDYGDGYAWSKVIWDVAVPSWIIEPSWVPTKLDTSPILTDELTYQRDDSRHVVRVAYHVKRDAVLGDVFKKVTGFKKA